MATLVPGSDRDYSSLPTPAANSSAAGLGHANRRDYAKIRMQSTYKPNAPLLDPMGKLKVDVKSAKTPEAKAKIMLDAITDAKLAPNAAKATTEIMGAGLSVTQGAEKAQLMASLIKSSDSPATMTQQLTEIKPELTSLNGAKMGHLDPVAFATLPLKNMDVAGSTWPANVKLRGNQDGLNLANVTASGLDVLETTGTIKANGADVSGGAINNSVDKTRAIKNAAKLGVAGAKTGFRIADPNGNPLTIKQAMDAHGMAGVEKAIMNGLNNAPKVHTAADHGAIVQTPNPMRM